MNYNHFCFAQNYLHMVSPSSKVLVVIDASSGVVLHYRQLTSEEPFTVNVYDTETQRSLRGMFILSEGFGVFC